MTLQFNKQDYWRFENISKIINNNNNSNTLLTFNISKNTVFNIDNDISNVVITNNKNVFTKNNIVCKNNFYIMDNSNNTIQLNNSKITSLLTNDISLILSNFDNLNNLNIKYDINNHVYFGSMRKNGPVFYNNQNNTITLNGINYDSNNPYNRWSSYGISMNPDNMIAFVLAYKWSQYNKTIDLSYNYTNPDGNNYEHLYFFKYKLIDNNKILSIKEIANIFTDINNIITIDDNNMNKSGMIPSINIESNSIYGIIIDSTDAGFGSISGSFRFNL